MADLKTDYKDDIIDSSVNVNRTFSIIDNTTGQIIYPNVSLEETTVFTQEGDSHTAQITNEQNIEINQINASLTAKSLVNTYYDSSVNKLYQVNSDGTKGDEIKMTRELDIANKVQITNTAYVTTKVGALYGGWTRSASTGDPYLYIDDTAIGAYDGSARNYWISMDGIPIGTKINFAIAGITSALYFIPYK